MDKNSFICLDDEKRGKVINKEKLAELLETFKMTKCYCHRRFEEKEKSLAFVEIGTKLGKSAIDCSPEVMNVLLETIIELNEYKRELEDVRNKAIYDDLTGVYNRRYLKEEGFPKTISHAIRYNEPISVIMIDVNNFKGVNDTYGHLVGDEVLKYVAQSIQASTREYDIVARYGGDEFCVLCPHTNLKGVRKLEQRIQQNIDAQTFKNEDLTLKITITAGSSSREYITRGVNSAHTETTDELIYDLISEADFALYSKKENRKSYNA